MHTTPLDLDIVRAAGIGRSSASRGLEAVGMSARLVGTRSDGPGVNPYSPARVPVDAQSRHLTTASATGAPKPVATRRGASWTAGNPFAPSACAEYLAVARRLDAVTV